MISAPTVNAVITDGKASITGNFTAATASELAAKIQGGALPFALQTSNFSTVNPTLGRGPRNRAKGSASPSTAGG